MIRQSLSLISLIVVAGCTPQLDDLQAYTQDVKSRAQPQIEPYEEFKAQPPFAYTASNIKSPFKFPEGAAAPLKKPRIENCSEPNFERAKEPLEAYGLDALELMGNIEIKGQKWALIQSNDGILHKAKTGSRIGVFYGTITQVNTDSITIRQLLPDGAGCWQRKITTMNTASKAGE
tara:strand:- start:137 stop:664 length:528 start_codon:yes stop_codon:yes gene_type:complete